MCYIGQNIMLISKRRHTVQVVMRVMYGMEVESYSDPCVALSEEVTAVIVEASRPDTQVLDMIPFCERIDTQCPELI